jgi:hypothetical protein
MSEEDTTKGRKWTPKQRAKFKATMKGKANGQHRHKTATAIGREQRGNEAGDIPAATLAYAMGRIEAWVEGYAGSEHVSARTLAFRLGQLLQRKARG